jgi:hypothetical protein
MNEGEQKIPFKFYLVNKQVDLAYDGIIGRDFLRNMQAKICYDSNTIVIKTPNGEWTKRIGDMKNVKENRRSSTLKVPKRSEIIVRIPVENGVEGADGLTDKTEITRGVYLASSLIRIEGDQTITSILNTNETDVGVEIPAIKSGEYKTGEEESSQKYIGSIAPIKREIIQNRAHEVLVKLRLENLNPEERQVMEDTCRDYHDIFYLPGDTLICTTTVKHSISVIPGTSPINTRLYRLAESQKAKVDKQVDKLLKEEVIKKNSVVLVRKRTTPTERPQPAGEVYANFS